MSEDDDDNSKVEIYLGTGTPPEPEDVAESTAILIADQISINLKIALILLKASTGDPPSKEEVLELFDFIKTQTEDLKRLGTIIDQERGK